jgi:hypothetical protein
MGRTNVSPKGEFQSDRGRCNSGLWCDVFPPFPYFQYPQSDRGRCNLTCQRIVDLRDVLSVSSVGSWALQPRRRRSPMGRKSTFQYPQSDRGRCNLTPPPPGGWEAPLSVSSVGSWALQPTGDHHPPVSGQHLSVSSVGSWALQPEMPPALPSRGGLSVSSVGSWALQRWITDEQAVRGVTFQYPQSDRGRCNLPTRIAVFFFLITFSILSRIVGAATSCVHALPFNIL